MQICRGGLQNNPRLSLKMSYGQKLGGRPRRTKKTTRSKFTVRSEFYYRAVIYDRGAPCADTIFLGITDIAPLKEGSAA